MTATRRRITKTLKPVLFDSGPPSNFHPATIHLPNPWTRRMEEFADNEHAFQAYKEFFATHGSRKGYELIRIVDTAGKAKRMGRQVKFTNDDRIRWDLFVAPVRMLEVCVAKFVQDKECHEWLRATGRRVLVEHRTDPIWGDNLDGTGKNMLGKTLMLVRTHLWGI